MPDKALCTAIQVLLEHWPVQEKNEQPTDIVPEKPEEHKWLIGQDSGHLSNLPHFAPEFLSRVGVDMTFDEAFTATVMVYGQGGTVEKVRHISLVTMATDRTIYRILSRLRRLGVVKGGDNAI